MPYTKWVTMKHLSHQEVAEKLSHAIGQLPLADCTGGRNRFTGNFEFVAPEGMAFKLGGAFEQVFDLVTDFRPPIASVGMMEQLGDWTLNDFDEEYGHDTPEPLYHFLGSRLLLALGRHGGAQFAEPLRPSYISNEEDLAPHLTIKSPLLFELETGYGEITIQAGLDSRRFVPISFESPNSVLSWRDEVAEGTLPGATIELVPHVFPAQHPVFIENHGETELEVVSLHADGQPASRLWVVHADTEGNLPPYSELLKRVDHEKLMQSFTSRQAYEAWRSEQDLIEHLAQKRQEHTTQLAIIEQSGSLIDLISTHAGRDWLDNLLEQARQNYNIPF